ncbi:MAG: hypothetical protein ACRCWQ_08520 [Bacilli bacterium]
MNNIYINGLKIETTRERPRIPVSVPTFDRGRSVLSNGDFGYNKRYEPRSWSFSTYQDVSTLSQADTHEIVIDKRRYYANLTSYDISPLDSDFVETALTFNVQPFAYLLENEPVKFGSLTSTGQQTLAFRALGSVDSEPIIEIYGTRDTETWLTFDDSIIKLTAVPGYLKIDCREYRLNVYDANGQLRNDLLTSEFIRLAPGNVGVSMSPGIRVELTGNWRDL